MHECVWSDPAGLLRRPVVGRFFAVLALAAPLICQTPGTITTAAGTGVTGFSGDGGLATSARQGRLLHWRYHCARGRGQIPGNQTYSTTALPTLTINNIEATVFGAALAPGFAGLYQVAIQVPASLADGDWPIVVSVGGVQTSNTMLLSVRR
jgi:uncharacterized protein (TIGR03437 family)